VPEFLANALLKALAKDPRDRFATIETFAEAIWPEHRTAPTVPLHRASQPRRRPPSTRLRKIETGAAIALSAVLAVLIWRWEPTPPAQETYLAKPDSHSPREAAPAADTRRSSPRSTPMAPVITTLPPYAPAPGTAPVADGPLLNCSNPSLGVRNPDNACYDVRPVSRTITTYQAPASCGGRVRPAIVLLVVTQWGMVETSELYGSSGCRAFDQLAVAFANDLTFRPATKAGKMVSAWILLPIRPT
jgi:hypothetical protein